MVRCWHPLAPNRPRFGELRAALHAAVHVDPTALTEPADPDGIASAAAAELAAQLASLAVSAGAAATTAQCAIDHEYDTDLPIAIRRPDTDNSRPSSCEHQYDEELPSSLRGSQGSPTSPKALEPEGTYPEGVQGYTEPCDSLPPGYSDCGPAVGVRDDAPKVTKADRMSRWVSDFEARGGDRGREEAKPANKGRVRSWFGSVGRFAGLKR